MNEMRKPTNDVYASMSSLIEIAIKTSIGKLSVSGVSIAEIPELLSAMGVELLPVEPEDCNKLSLLKISAKHRDPFDRLIISQAIRHNMTLISPVKAFSEYKPDGLRLLWDEV
jgi:PIN domain nuclease of toxin-antitoxin system